MPEPPDDRQRQPSVRPTSAPRPKPLVPDHELLRRIGEGAYGEVWLARSVLGTYRAVKLVYRDTFQDARPYEREYRGIQKFEPISRSNEGFVDILQIGRNEEAGHFYYVMELADDAHHATDRSPAAADAPYQRYAPKTLLSEIKRRGRLPFDEGLPFAISLTLALSHLHRQGLIHRDIKPSNIIFVGNIPKLADIGLVSDLGEARSFVGTEGFIPPEGPNSSQADIYSLGKVIYEMSMGKDRLDFPEPFTGLGQTDGSGPLEELNAIILKACAPEPQDRYQSADDMLLELALLQSGKSVKSKRRMERHLARASRAAVLVGFIAIAATLGFLYQRHQTREATRLRLLAEDLSAQTQIQNAEYLCGRDQSSLALAHLAFVLRNHPANRVAAERIASAISQRRFPRLGIKPLLHPQKLQREGTHRPARLSPDGSRILTVGEDHAVRLWSAQTGEELIPPIRHQETVYAAEFSPDGTRFLCASDDRMVTVADVQSGRPLFAPLPHDRAVLHAAFSPDGARLATASFDGTARVFDAHSGALIAGPLVHVGPVNEIAFTPDNTRLATAMEGGRVRIWEINGARELHRFRLDGPVRMVRFSPDNAMLAAAIYAEHEKGIWRVEVWNTTSGRPVTHPLLHQNRIFSIEFSPDSKQVITATANNAARLWQVETGQELRQFQHSSLVYSAVFSPDGSRVLTTSVDRTARIWDAASGAALAEPMLHEGRVLHGEFSRDGMKVLTAGWEDKSVKLWVLPPLGAPRPVLRHESWIGATEMDDTGTQIIASSTSVQMTAADDNTWADLDSQRTPSLWKRDGDGWKLATPPASGMEAVTAGFTAESAKALVSKRTSQVHFSAEAQIQDLRSPETPGPKLHHDRQITCAHFSPDGLKLATGSMDGVLNVWNARNGARLSPPRSQGERLRSVRFNTAGSQVVTTTDQGKAFLWDILSGNPATQLSGHQDMVWLAQFNRQGDRVVTASLDYTAKVWSTNGECLVTLRHPAPVEFAEFSPDGTRVVTAAGSEARVWDAAAGRQLTEPLQHRELVTSAAFGPDGLRVVTASKDRTAQLWDARTGLKLAEPFVHEAWVVSAKFSADGGHVITACLDRSARIWPVPVVSAPFPSWLPQVAEAVAGQRLSPDRIPQAVSWEELQALRLQLLALPDQDPLVQQARQLVGDVEIR